MRFRLIDAKQAELPIERMCMLLHVSVSGYYAWQRRTPSRRQLAETGIKINLVTAQM